MNRSSFKRQKAGKSFPGDVSRRTKIAMVENTNGVSIVYGGDYVQQVSAKACSGYRKEIAERKNKRFRQKSKLELRKLN